MTDSGTWLPAGPSKNTASRSPCRLRKSRKLPTNGRDVE